MTRAARGLVLIAAASSAAMASACTLLLGTFDFDGAATSTGSGGGGGAGPACPELANTDPWADQLGPRTLADRGEILACAHVATYSRADVAVDPSFLSTIGPATNGYDLFVIQYVSETRPAVAGAATALLYVPSGGATSVPMVALDHAFYGTGPSCGPSRNPSMTDPLAVPLVARGYAVVAPDYAGVGVDNGMTSFLIGRSEAAATLDGVRALRLMHDARFDARQLGRELFVVGHSQGGHAALFTHQLFDPTLGLDFRGSVAVAPAFGSAREWAPWFRDPHRPVFASETFAAAWFYSHALYRGAPTPAAWLTPTAQARLPELLHDNCMPDVIPAVSSSFPTLGDIYQPSFLSAAAACNFEGPCPGFEPWATSLLAEEAGNFSSTVPSLILQGLADGLVPPAVTACVVDRMKAHGTPVRACAYKGRDHLTVFTDAVPAMLQWMAARRLGTTPDVCSAPLTVVCDATP